MIELLVVIAIINILAAILFPVFARARENARKASCISNLKQLGLAVMMYTQDFDERAFGARNGQFWSVPYMSHIKTPQILKCPSAPVASAARLSHYNVNGQVLRLCPASATTCVPNEGQAIPLFAFDASKTLFALDGGGTTYWGSGLASAGLSQTAAGVGIFSETEFYAIADRHLGGSNCVFLDGHVKWLPRQKIFLKENGTPVPSIKTYYGETHWPTNSQQLTPSIWYTAP